MTDKILQKVRGYYESAVTSSSYQKWRKEAQSAWDFYDGEQWTKDEIDRLADNGQAAIVINKIATKIDNLSGTEISGRTRILYRSRSGDKTEEATAKALSDLALYVAERNDQAIELSSMFKEGLVTGLSWLDMGVMQADEGVLVFNRHEQACDVVWDPMSRRMDYSDGRFVCRHRWLDEDEVKRLFPDNHEKVLAQLKSAHESGLSQSSWGRSGNDIDYTQPQEGLARVVEVQYRQTEKSYRVKEESGFEFVTFDKDVAYANSNNEVTSEFHPRVYLAYFSGNILLSHQPLSYEFNHFTLIPFIYKRHHSDGRPYGLVKAAIDPQREFNKRRSKAMHLLNTAQVIADIDAVDDPNILAREAARPDGVILKRPGKDLRILRNTDLAASQVAVMDQSARDIQEVIGVFDESIGKTSNATSGVAIQQRQMAGSLNQMFAFDALRRSKKAVGQVVLSLIRQFFTNEMVIQITDQLSAPRVVHLNQPLLDDAGNAVSSDGKGVKVNDVRIGQFDVLVEEVRDVSSSRELEMNQLSQLRAAGIPVPAKLLVEATNIRNKEEVIAALSSNKEEVNVPE